MQRLLSQIGRTPRLTVLNHLKRHAAGLTVTELASRLDMSYMGVKQVCLDLEKHGYVDTFRRHRGVGRPELLYRLTRKSRDLFPQADNTLAISLLEQARKLYGTGAPGKMLYLFFQDKTAGYAAKITGGNATERAKSLVRLRDQEGYMADCEAEPSLRITERHHPMRGLLEAFPEAEGLEREMFQKLLGAPIRFEPMANAENWERVIVVG